MREATGSGAQPTRIGRYELLARLAVGGMGELFVARLEGAAGFEKLFVVKRILPPPSVATDRKRAVKGKRVDLGGGRIL